VQSVVAGLTAVSTEDSSTGRLAGTRERAIKMQIRPEKMSEWLALADSYAKDVNSEDGCLFFQFARSLTDDSEFVCIEGFTDAEAGATHVKQPYVKKFFNTAPDLVATQPQIIYIDTPHDGFGPMGEIQPR
jgi:quinol monooxygenase YgiN